MSMDQQPGIVCLSHLGWDFVWQRPQQILSRLAERFPILYVNEPAISDEPDAVPELELVTDDGRLAAWQPVFPSRPEALAEWRSLYHCLLEELVIARGWAVHDGEVVPTRPLILWFYTPTPFYLAQRLPADVIVYDVMDDLHSFKGGPADLPEREACLLEMADVVFAGGRSLYDARRAQHSNLHLLPSGVEVKDFERARDWRTPVAAEIADLPRPVLGYIGVIDERIDLELLDELARQNPQWSVALVGPVVKIEPETLPQRPNIRYLDRQPYERLPEFLKGFDVCLMPFALNEATRHISPTKTLEYMAAGKPVVSTAVPDVVASWGDVVRIATGRQEFAAQIGAALRESAAGQMQRQARAEQYLRANNWQAIADHMAASIEAALGARTTAASGLLTLESNGFRR